MTTYLIVLYFENHTFASDKIFKVPNGTPTDAVLDLATEDYEGFSVD